MALGLGLLGLLGLGHFAKRGIEDRDREKFETGFGEAMGRAPGLYDANPGDMATGGVDQQRQDPGEGLLADPTSLQNQLGFAKNIFGLRGGQDMAEALTTSFLDNQQRNAEQARGIASREAIAQENRQVQAEIAGDKLFSDQYFKAMDISRKAINQTSAGLPDDPNMRRVSTGEGALDFVDVPKPDTPTWQKEFLTTKKLERSITNLDSLTEMFKDTGTFETGRQSGQLTTLHAASLQALREAFDMGVLSDSDQEFLERVLVDPQTIEGNMLTSNNRILGGYEQALKLLQDRLRDRDITYKTWGINSTLDEQTPSQAKRSAARAERLSKAKAHQLVPDDAAAAAPRVPSFPQNFATEADDNFGFMP